MDFVQLKKEEVRLLRLLKRNLEAQLADNPSFRELQIAEAMIESLTAFPMDELNPTRDSGAKVNE